MILAKTPSELNDKMYGMRDCIIYITKPLDNKLWYDVDEEYVQYLSKQIEHKNIQIKVIGED